MNPNSFSILGYISVLLWLAVPLLWLLRRRFTLPGWLALALAILSLALATHNSLTHVNRIEVEQAEETINQLDAAAAKRKNVEEARGGEVADIRFAEDGDDDFIDKAGMNDADKKYLDSIDESKEPAWKGKKKKRGDADEQSGDLEDEIGGKEAISGVKSDSLQTEESRPPILMTEAHKATANRIDGHNLNAARIAILLGFLIFIIDYFTRANSYARAVFPLPLPASWLNAFSPLPAVIQRPNPPRRNLPEELAWLAKRGDVFICFTKDASGLPESLPRFAKKFAPIDLLHVDSPDISDELIFESLWYGRSSFVVDSLDRINSLFGSIYLQLEQRHKARARSRCNVHIVWNIDQQLHEDDIADFERFARSTGFSLFICNEPIS
ncbi:MAG: hypothetical protein V4727_13540 [Verrucomicrobiota bacterium]